ncbi:MAG: GNAT family N-acetyltransferase [Candidatus Eisenbacteria bacterium]|nr:GNAT family N-acetyltransferase [Candidatus Eisenbacteria bacterium]
MRWEARGYRPGDEEAILELFRVVFGEAKMTLAIWNWLYRENPEPDPIIGLAFDQETRALVAHGAVLPLPALLRGRRATFGLAMDAMTDPAVRGAALGRRGAFVLAAEQVIGRIVPRMPLAYGFPGERHLALGRLLLGYEPIGPVPSLGRALDPPGEMRRERFLAPWKIHRVLRFGVRADELWRAVRRDYPLALYRNSRYLNWRYFKIPHHRYRVFALTGRLGRWKGWAVLSVEGKTARLVDLFVPRGIPDGTESLVRRALDEAARMGAERCVAWMPKHSPGRPLLEKLGFLPEPEEEQDFLAVRIHDRTLTKEAVERSFHFQMGDSDMF